MVNIRRLGNMADLMRVKGVGEDYATLLEAAGVDTVKELRRRNATNLTARLAEINNKHRIVRRNPSEAVVRQWVDRAGVLKPVTIEQPAKWTGTKNSRLAAAAKVKARSLRLARMAEDDD